MIARPVELFFFHDLVLTVVEAEQSRYVALKPIVEMLGLSWKRAREGVMDKIGVFRTTPLRNNLL